MGGGSELSWRGGWRRPEGRRVREEWLPNWQNVCGERVHPDCLLPAHIDQDTHSWCFDIDTEEHKAEGGCSKNHHLQGERKECEDGAKRAHPSSESPSE